MAYFIIYDADDGSGYEVWCQDKARMFNTTLQVSTDTRIASGLSYTDLHTLEVVMEFVDGLTFFPPEADGQVRRVWGVPLCVFIQVHVNHLVV
jgi:hypothetical protein